MHTFTRIAQNDDGLREIYLRIDNEEGKYWGALKQKEGQNLDEFMRHSVHDLATMITQRYMGGDYGKEMHKI